MQKRTDGVQPGVRGYEQLDPAVGEHDEKRKHVAVVVELSVKQQRNAEGYL
jgi:hypothetical protein